MGLTQKELADKVGLTQNGISSIEKGIYNPNALTTALMCEVFKCKWEDCFYLSYRKRRQTNEQKQNICRNEK